ncbi:MAG: flavin-dependent oxidoreductase [Polyangiales bacterium]
MRVIIAGGGIGGLVSALSLRELGFDVHVYEAVQEVRPLGVGINVLPHAVRELMELGLGPALERAGILTAELAYYSKHGKAIWREPRGRDAGYAWPQVSIHRGQLHMLLLETVQARLGADRLHLGHALDSFTQNARGVTAHFVDRDGAPLVAAEGDVLIGADGIHSRTRRQLFPNEGAPAWNGTLLWRGVTVGAPFLTGRSMIMAGHETQKFVAYPIAHERDGRALINWIAELRFAPGECAVRETWNAPGDLDEFLPRFQSWKFGWLDVPRLITEAEHVYVYPLVDRDPLPHWSEGRVTLLGDAAHPMYPVGSNGASQAVLDARVLTSCLRDASDVESGLAKYESVRRPATAALTLANRQQGPEACMTLVEARAPDGFTDVADVVTQDELEAISSKYKRLAGFSVDELNRRPSLAAVRY